MFGDEIMCVVNTIGDGLTYFADLINLPEFIDYVVTDFKAEFSAFIETAKTDLPGAITNFVESYKAKIAFVVAEIKAAQEAVIAGVVNQINAIIDSVKATISKITATIDAIKADIVSVLDNANAALVKLVDSIKEQILAAQAVLELVTDKIIEVTEFIETLPELIEKTINEALIVAENIKNAVIEQVNLFVDACVEKYNEFMNSQFVADAKAFIDALPELIEEAKAQIQAQLEVLIPQVKAELENLVAEIKVNLEILVAEIQVKVEILVAEFIAQVEYQLSVFKAQVEYQLAVVKAELQAKVEKLIAEAIACYELTKANISALIEEVIAIINAYIERYYDATSSEFHLDANSYYVALGDSSIVAEGSYPDLYAESLGLTDNHYKNLGNMGMRIDDIRYLLDSSFEGDQYSELFFGEENKDAWVADIEKANLVTISFSGTSFLEYAALQMIYPTECNWNNFFGSKANAISSLISELLVDVIIKCSDVTEELSTLAVSAVEGFLYSYVGYWFNIVPTIEAIKAINPEANVVLVGFSTVDNVAPQEAAPVTFAAAPAPSITTLLSLLPEDVREVFMNVYNAMVGIANTTNLAYSYASGDASFIDIGSAVTADEIVATLHENITITGSIPAPQPPINPEHTCTPGSTWISDATHHWKECADPTCTKGTRFEEEEHNYNQKKVDVAPQPGVPGEGHDECICGKHSPEGSYTLDPLPEGEDPINPPKKAEKNDLVWLWITLPSVILVGAGIGLFFFIRKKFAVKKEG